MRLFRAYRSFYHYQITWRILQPQKGGLGGFNYEAFSKGRSPPDVGTILSDSALSIKTSSNALKLMLVLPITTTNCDLQTPIGEFKAELGGSGTARGALRH